MEQEFDDIDILIAKVMAGEADAEEIKRLDAWRMASAENQQRWENSKKMMESMLVSVNTDAAWNKLEQRISKDGATIIPLYKRTQLRVAAALLLLAVLGLVAKLVLTPAKAEQVMFASAQAPVQKQLPDGSSVFINKHSELSYVEGKEGLRQVQLKGEAFFEVLHDAEKPFEVSVGGVLIRDIGTAFNVKALPGSNTVEVWVESGEVHFYSADNAGVHLLQGEKAVYNQTTKQFIKAESAAAENANSYKTLVFRFNETPLSEVLTQLNAVYDKNVHVNDEATGNLRLSVKFDHEHHDTIVNIIAETLDLDIDRSGTGILLKRKETK